MHYGPKCFYEDGVTSRRIWPRYPQAGTKLLTHVKPPEPPAIHHQAIATLAEADSTAFEPSLHDILRAVCAVTEVPMRDLISPRRERQFVRARFLYFHVARTVTHCSFPQIGKHCGRRDHTTVMHGVHSVETNRARYEGLIDSVLRKLA